MVRAGFPDRSSRARLRDLPLWIRILGTGFYSGYAPIAPGTAGSLLALGLYWFIPPLGGGWTLLTALSLCGLITGIYVSQKIFRILGGDPSLVVIDEMTGMWVSLIALPRSIYIAIIAFFLFRFFDIMKPPPASSFDRMKGGVGIMLDDVVAGIYANIIVQILVLAISA